MVKQIEIYTDGACRGNPGPGGYGAVLKYRRHRKEISGGFRETTNNRMEIFAAIAALEQLIEPCEITLYSDSRYLVDAVSKRWLANWKRRGWIKADKQPVLNVDLWRRLEAAMAPHRLKFVWVRGHASNAENNRCDELAVAAATRGNLPEDPR
ncbi:ribonuclease HI [uncultured Victivallis sp.]|uniref:ribonuclease HI n=1 Tax=uncultured Victivallis sp. TaxID=354118 RepID=UPI003457C430